MKPTHIILHHSASPQNQTAKAIDNYHRQKWNFKSSLGHYAGYQYIIEANGNIFQARKDTEIGAHCKQKEMNHKSIGICVVGWYDDGHDGRPTKEQEESLAKLLKEKMKQWDIKEVEFHRDYAPYKTCPGLRISRKYINNLLNNMEKTKKAIKKYIYDFGEKINENEDKKIAKKIKAITKELEELRNYECDSTPIVQEMAKKLEEARVERDNCEISNEKTERTVQGLEKGLEIKEASIEHLQERTIRQAKEISRLQAINQYKAEDTKIIDAIVFVIKTIKTRLK